MPWFTSIRVADINLARVFGQRFVPNDLTVTEINNTATKWLETNGEPRNENPSWTEMIVLMHETHFELFITHTKLSRTSVYLHAIDPQISSFSETIKTWVMRTDCRYQTFVSSWSQIDHNSYFRGFACCEDRLHEKNGFHGMLIGNQRSSLTHARGEDQWTHLKLIIHSSDWNKASLSFFVEDPEKLFGWVYIFG